MTVSRREALTLGLGVATTGVVAQGANPAVTTAAAGGMRDGATTLIPQRPSARVIVDNDFAGDPDGLVALAHQLMSAKTRVTLVTSIPLNPKYGRPETVGRGSALGAQSARDLLGFFGRAGSLPVVAGAVRTRLVLVVTFGVDAVRSPAQRCPGSRTVNASRRRKSLGDVPIRRVKNRVK